MGKVMGGDIRVSRKRWLILGVLLPALCLIPGHLYAKEADGWNIRKATHFIIYYKNASEDFISQLEGNAEDYYKSIADELGFSRFNFWTWDARAKIYIYDNAGDYRKATGEPGWSGGVAIAELKTIKTFAFAGGFMETLLPHEIGHIIFREFVGFRNPVVPLWLDEGVATYREKDRYAGAREFLKQARSRGRFLALDKLSGIRRLQGLDDYSVRVFYSEAFSIVDFMISEYGSDSFVDLCRGLRDKKGMTEALKSAFSFESIKEMETAWEEFLGN